MRMLTPLRGLVNRLARLRAGRTRRSRPPMAQPTLERLEERCLLSTGGLDPSFDGDGQRTVTFDLGAGNNDRARGVVVQPDGKIVIAGNAQTSGTDSYDFAVVRLNPNGSLDTTFDGDGKLTIPFNLGGDNDDAAWTVALQSDGKIVVAGHAERSSSGGGFDMAVARLHSNGSLDTTFSGDGKQTVAFNLGGNNEDRAYGVAVQGDGKIVLAGQARRSSSDESDFAVARLTASGTLDTTFSGDGLQTIAFSAGAMREVAQSLVLQSDGRIVLAGSVQRDTNGDHDFGIARLTVTGGLDATFSGDGLQTVAFNLGGNNNDRAIDVALQADGAFVLVGRAQRVTTGDGDMAVARLTPSGALDPTFSGDGLQTIAFNLGGDRDDAADAVAVQLDGKIVVSGQAQFNAGGDYDFAVARLNPDGSPDATFDGDGQRTIFFDLGADNDDNANDLVIGPDGSIILVGRVQRTGTRDYDFGIVRLIGDQWVVTAPDEGGPPLVRIHSPTGTRYREFAAYGASFRGGVRVALADINGDRVPEIFTAPGPTGQPYVNVFDGVTTQLLHQVLVYGISFTLGVNLAVADVLGTGAPQIITAPEAGGQPYVNIFQSTTGTLLQQFLAYGVTFTGGVRLAIADADGDGVQDILTAPQASGAPFVNMFRGATGSLIRQMQVYGDTFTGGIYLASGNVNGVGRAELIVGPGSGGQPIVNAFDIATGTLVRQYQVYGLSFTAGVRVSAVEASGDTFTDLLTGPGPGGQPYVQVVDGNSGSLLRSFLAYDLSLASGLFVLGHAR